MAKDNSEDFKKSTKCCICQNDCVYNNVKVRGHCHIIGKYRGSAHRDCKINLKLNHKIPVIFHNLKSYDSHLIMHELGKFNVKINIMPIY